MKKEILVGFLHEHGKNFVEIARELGIPAKEVAVLWARCSNAREKFITREKVVYRKRLINKKIKK